MDAKTQAIIFATRLSGLVLQMRSKWLADPVTYYDDPRPLEVQWFHHRSVYRKNYLFTDSVSLVRAVKWSLITFEVEVPPELEPYSHTIAKTLINATRKLGKADDRQLAKCEKGVSYEILDAIHSSIEERVESDLFWSIK